VSHRTKRSDEELREASNWLKYEIWMFRGLAEMIALGQTDGLVKNAILDSFLIHTRALLSFFYAYNPHKNDAIAEDYFSSSEEWINMRPIKSDYLEGVHNRISKSVAHISYVRNKSSWDCSKIARENDL
jgi:hypothetical protein